ncbi:hypothetical protein CN957_06735 [Bacillus cereus]|nr:hypothetical protein CN957_06735 [Bacillus cereus]
MNIYLDKLQKLTSTEDIISFIRGIYENTEGLYIPALVSEGNFIGELKADFYVKLVLKHTELTINKTWLIGNLSFCLPTFFNIKELNEENSHMFIHNLIVYKNYRNASIYQVNPLLTAMESYQENGVKNLKYVEAYFDKEYQSNKGNLILDYNNKENNEYLNVLKSFLAEHVVHEEQKWKHPYELVAEFEYRNINHSPLKENYTNTSSGFIDYFHSNEHGVNLRGSIKIPLKYSQSNTRSVKVIDLGTNEERKHNPNHYNGDIEEGFVVFSKEAMEILQQEYFFYDIQMIEKNYLENAVLVDYLGDRVVFWEAEYNKLPSQLKDKIDKYNIVPADTKIISKAMYSMQLAASWNWDKDLEPDKKLAYIIKNKMFERAIDMNLNFIYPQNVKDLQNFIYKIENLTQINLEKFNTNATDVKKLITIRDGKYKDNITEEYIEELYLKYCFAISEKFGGEN